MAGTGGFAVSRSHGGDRFYNPPAMRRHQQLLLQQQLQRPEKSPAAAAAVAAVPEAAEAQKRSESDGSVSALSKKASDCGSSEAKKVTNESNIDRLMEAVTPNVAAKYCPEVNGRGWRSREAGLRPFYNLGDLWESLKEWSVYGAGVPMIIKETDSVVQYYVPYLSGLQLYADPSKRPANNSEYEADRRKHVADGSHQNAVNLSSQKMKSLSLRDKYPVNSSGEEGGNSNSPGLLVFEYLEYEQPYSRKPLTDKILNLESQFPELSSYRSCDLLPSSWISIAWYPIYRIPMGSTLKDLDASFLTIHPLSTHFKNGGQSQSHGSSCVGKVINASAGSSKISLPVIGLASYKYKGSILSPSAPQDYEHENSLLEAANSWLQGLNVALPDLQFFRSHYSRR
ncbi:uncharacterized protein LOC108220229 isoform X2 [Daucus carota subsp. sativus]|uniref:uncharacterized protein LOC108220229 isoform X2 n=1 Tax=Daucus carota subsp. sativus TaxID=79200 RepID=UPI0007EF11F3|nr:PREDICTED: uncharacterized protein LOC108220229 [Daucus carota subsp. sativus]